MTTRPDQHIIDLALQVAAMSPCRSKRGVVLYDPGTGAHRGSGYNGPPAPHTCPGRAICAGTCGQRSVHAETRALQAAEHYRRFHPPGPYDLVHVELAPGPYAIEVERSPDGLPIGQAPHVVAGQVLPCDGPSCLPCAARILDVGFVGGVWLYLGVSRCLACRRFEDSSNEADRLKRCPDCGAYLTPQGVWRRYTAQKFYRVTLERCGMTP